MAAVSSPRSAATRPEPQPGFVLLEDGRWFRGEHPGTLTPAFGEVVFTTNLTGYQETFTDPSYLGQIVVMTAPMIGNYGVTPEDGEAAGPQVAGVVVRELSHVPSNWRSEEPLGGWLHRHHVPLLEGVDTRALTRHLRERGAMRGLLAPGETPTDGDRERLQASPSMSGRDLASTAGVTTSYEAGSEGPRVVAFDFGMKRNIVRMLVEAGCRVTVVPARTTVAEVVALAPDGIFLSNGPGDPSAIPWAVETIRTLVERRIPTFGICLGHQLLGLAFGGHTTKLPYGHRGGNHPVRDLATGRVLITAQNHGFALAGDEHGVPGAPDLTVTHVNLNDGTVEGIRHQQLPMFGVQYHPEASPGPHDAWPHFGDFMSLLRPVSV